MRVLDHVCLDKMDVRRMSEEQLSARGLRLVNHADVVLQCLRCEETWEPTLDSGGKLPHDYWKCPAGCNA